jgi:oligoribonuclease (3'-5' exoribonuclease)
MTQNSFYWHDYETFGVDPQRDRAVQFAGIRTDFDGHKSYDTKDYGLLHHQNVNYCILQCKYLLVLR